MIRLLKDYYDTHGIRYKVLSFSGGKYCCQSYHDGRCIFLKPEELFISPPAKPAKVKFTDVVKKEPELEVLETVKEEKTLNTIAEPVYEEPVYEEPIYEVDNYHEEIQNVVPLKDNIEETANNDFYADF